LVHATPLFFSRMKARRRKPPILAIVPLTTFAQGTFVFDEQSSDESNGGSSLNVIQTAHPTGQSFTPSLNGIGFVRLNLFDENRNNSQGATIFVNLRSDSITGSIISSTAPVTLPDNFGFPLNTGYATFFLPTDVPLQPGTKYFLQPVVQSGDLWGMFGGSFGYPGGDLYANGIPGSSDYWFREGVIVPEPSAVVLLVTGVGAQSVAPASWSAAALCRFDFRSLAAEFFEDCNPSASLPRRLRILKPLLVGCNSNDFTVSPLSPSDGERVRVRGSL